MAAASFIDKLSRWLMVILGILALVAIPNYIIHGLTFEPDGGSPEEFRWSQIQVWVAVCNAIIAWVVPFVAAWFLGKRRDWARHVIILFLAAIGIAAAAYSVFFLLSVLGVVESKGPMTLPLLGNATPMLLTGVSFAGLAFAYLCWRLISRLRSAEIREEFREPPEPASTPR
jgi:hypothetical protein